MMKTGKNKCYKRIIAFLSVLVILFAGFNVGEVVLAADYITPDGYLTPDHIGNSCNIHTDYGAATCYIVTEESEQKLHYYELSGSPEMYNQEKVMLVTGDSITINSDITLYVYSSPVTVTVKSGATLHVYDSNVNVTVDGGTLVLHGNSYPQITVNSGDVIVADGVPYMMDSMAFTTGTLTVNSGARFEGVSSSELANATVTNNGTIQFLSSFEDNSASFTNNGTIEAASVKITTTTFADSATASYKVTTGFEKGNFDLNGTIIPSNSALWDNEDVTIKSAGGKTTVKLDGVTVTKTEAVNTTAGEFVPKPTITFAGWPTNIYDGQTINYKDYIQTDMGTATITFADATDSDGLVYGPEYSKAPTTAGKHRVTVTVPASTSYREGSNSYIFNIKYLTGVGYCTVDQEPVKNDGYSEFYNTPITLRAPDGFVIAAVGGESCDLTSTYTISEDGYYMGQTGGVFERVSDGARTESGWLYPTYFLIDHTPPQIVQSSARDQDGVAISTEIKNGVILNARGVTFTIHDSVENFGNTLSSVTVDGEPIFVNTDEGNAEVSLKRTFPGKETHQIIAKDDLGNTSTWNITLNYLPTATPETPFTISGSEGKNGYYTSDITLTPATGYTISSDVNGTFTDSLAYKPDMENVYLMDAAGLYTAPIPVSFLIDKTGPQFSAGSDETGNNYEIVNGLEVHAKKLSFSVSDENLATVTVNGEAVDVVSGVANIELVPEAGNNGNYEIYAEDIAGNNIQATLSVEHLKEVATASVSVDAEYVGQKISPVLSTNSDGEAKFFYKRVGASDDTYVSEEPASEGEYIVQVRIPATDNFTAVTEEGTFKLSYLTAPETAFTVSGTPGKNDFYTSDVELVAPEGFYISGEAGGTYKASITYTEGMDKIYLMRKDGALTGAIAFSEKYKIDKVVPEASKTGTLKNSKTLKTKLIDIKNGMSIYADTLDFSIFDENLATLTINGETVEFNEKTAKILLDADNKTSRFNIIAEDKAGNTTSLSIVLKAAWLENNIIPSGAKITLEAGQVYNLEGGKWTVSGDSTVYYGGNSFCVDGPKDCVFTETK